MLEGLGFNLCVAPFLKVCVPNLTRGQKLELLELVGAGSDVLQEVELERTKSEGQ